MGIFNWGLTDKEEAMNKIQADYMKKNNGAPMSTDELTQIYMNSLDKKGKVSAPKVKKNVADFSKLPKFEAPMSNYDYGKDGLPPQLEAVRNQNEIDTTIEGQIAGSPSTQDSAFSNLPRQGFGNVVRPLDERIDVGPEPMQRGLPADYNEGLGYNTSKYQKDFGEGYPEALDTAKASWQDTKMNEYLSAKGGEYGAASNNYQHTPSPQEVRDVNADKAAANTLRSNFYNKMTGGPTIRDELISNNINVNAPYTPAPVKEITKADDVQRNIDNVSNMFDQASVAASEFAAPFIGGDQIYESDKGFSDADMAAFNEPLFTSEGVPSAPVVGSKPKAEAKSGTNPKTGKNTVKVAKNSYGQTPYVPKSKVAKDAANISLPRRGMDVGGRKEIDIGGNLVNSSRFATVDPLNLFGNKNGVNPFSSTAGTDRFNGGYVSNRKLNQDSLNIMNEF